ncbi:peptidoglycan editing factor PgeF [uncultured Clostridium sp.]|uniref:peptidoglycan editing factor PgeF n=1 Tax=uncultured Clostridium sp. TaxID=59620 RepID=UPI002636AAD4|nr:peptidoglycan editing factor PgeF [uncultured Clostridium sp.]
MEKIIIQSMEFLKIKDKNINILFSTAKNNVSYKLKDINTIKNFEMLQEIFDVKKVNYTNQVHGDNIINLDFNESIDKEADGLIISKANEISGVFTADCVPVIIYDPDKEVIATVHSGWKGTILDISRQAVNILKEKYKCENINVVIGPAVGICCYEVSEELVQRFNEKYGESISKGRMLDLKKVIRVQLADIVNVDKIIDLDICTNCSEDIEFYSYRKKKEEAGRLFSFAFIDS